MSSKPGMLLQNIIHDEVVALCQAFYKSARSLEIDGIICVTVLDSKEQQVIKIHKTLTSISGKPNEEERRQNSQPDSVLVPPNFQSDIATLDSLLKSATASCKDPQIENYKNKRKRKPPKQKQYSNIAEEVPDKIYSQKSEEQVTTNDTVNGDPYRVQKEVSSLVQTDSQRADSAIPENIVIKTEPQDPEYDSLNEHTTGIQNGIISHEKSVNEHRPASEPILGNDKWHENSPDYNLVKVEKMPETDENVFLDYYRNESIDRRVSSGELLVEKNGDKSENIGGSDGSAFDRFSSDMQQFSSFPTRRRIKKPIDGAKWIELVKNNVTRYQEALKRAGKMDVAVNELISDEHRLPRGASCPITEKQNQSRLPNLINMLNTPPLSRTRIMAIVPLDGDTGTSNLKKDSSIPVNDSRSSSDSPLPQIKIEVDDVDASYTGDHGDKHTTNQSPSLIGNSLLQNQNQNQTSGKLENRYPALFSQLQTGLQGSLSNTVVNSESLVNRLPFISFQDIFSTTSSSPKSVEQAEKVKHQWNWKKRKVRKSHDPVENLQRNSKHKSDSDNDWRPNVASDCSVESGERDSAWDSRTDRPKRRKSAKINFAELENSDIEFDEYDGDEGSASFPQFGSSAEEIGTSYKPDKSSSVQLMQALASNAAAIGSQSVLNSGGLPCSICGLDFNQEYRRNYHMIKVHGVAHESETHLFR